MGKTTPDIRQLSTCCGEILPWNQNNPGGWTAVCPRCEEQRFWSRPADGRPCRKLTATEDLLLARIAELEATLANERGEGEAPCEGWRWIPHIRYWQFSRGDLWMDARRDGVRWYWRRRTKQGDSEGSDNTARAAIRAASGAP